MSDFRQREIERTVDALLAVTRHLTSCRQSMAKVAVPSVDQVDTEIRNAMDVTSLGLIVLLNDLAGPIWGELPPEVRDVCRKAGMR